MEMITARKRAWVAAQRDPFNLGANPRLQHEGLATRPDIQAKARHSMGVEQIDLNVSISMLTSAEWKDLLV